MAESEHLIVARELALKAGDSIRQLIGTGMEVSHKESSASPVTIADTRSQQIILSGLQQKFPDFNVLAEEDKGRIDRGSNFTWIVDPLDGTTTAAREKPLPFYAVSIALKRDNEIIMGVIHNIASGDIYTAQKGEGAFLNGKAIHVSNVSTLDNALTSTGLQNTDEQRDLNAAIFELFRPLKWSKNVLNLMAAVNSAAYVASAEIDALIHFCKPWDFAAGAILVEEAGGRVTDWQGRPIDWSQDNIEAVFSNGLIHDRIIERLKRMEEATRLMREVRERLN